MILKHRAYKYLRKYQMIYSKSQNPTELYFGYGANLNPKRFKKLRMNYTDLGVANLKDHEINFTLATEYKHKSYAGVHGLEGSVVPGYLVKLDKKSLKYLDCLEWCGFGAYKRVKKKVVFENDLIEAWVYIVNKPDEDRYPSKIYLNNMIKAAEDNNFSKEYIDKLKLQKCKESFEIDPLFSLRTYSRSRINIQLLIPIYRIHDKLREYLCSII